MWVLCTKPGFSVIVASALNYWDIPPASSKWLSKCIICETMWVHRLGLDFRIILWGTQLPFFFKAQLRAFNRKGLLKLLPVVDGFCDGICSPYWWGLNHLTHPGSPYRVHPSSFNAFFIALWGKCVGNELVAGRVLFVERAFDLLAF